MRVSPDKQGLERRRFLNWEAMLVCSTKRAMGNASDDTPLDVRYPPRNPWLDGWADVLDIINSHAQVGTQAHATIFGVWSLPYRGTDYRRPW